MLGVEDSTGAEAAERVEDTGVRDESLEKLSVTRLSLSLSGVSNILKGLSTPPLRPCIWISGSDSSSSSGRDNASRLLDDVLEEEVRNEVGMDD